MIAFFANLFGYVLNFLYEIVGNYGWAIILFSILVKVVMIPISIAQQKSMKKSQKVNGEVKQIQFKYKNDPEKMNQEVMALYKREKMSPFSGCFSAIIQIILLISVFYLVRSPLTYMKKVDSAVLNKALALVDKDNHYKEIEVINIVNNIENNDFAEEQKNTENAENTIEEIQDDEENDVEATNNSEQEEKDKTEQESNTATEENKFDISQYKEELGINMEFLGIDLSKIPTQDIGNIKVLIIPILYVASSFVSIKLSTQISNSKKQKKENNQDDVGKDNEKDGENKEEENQADFADTMEETNKKMSFIMPFMSITIAMVAPLGLALYWLMNNLLMIIERIILNKVIKD